MKFLQKLVYLIPCLLLVNFFASGVERDVNSSLTGERPAARHYLKADAHVTVFSSGSCFTSKGEILTYKITIENTGDYPLVLEKVDILENGSFDHDIPLGSFILQPGNDHLVLISRPVSQTDIDNGQVSFQARLHANFTSFEFPEDLTRTSNTLIFPRCKIPDISMGLSISEPCFKNVGDTLIYTITVKNQGELPLINVRVLDTLTHLDTTLASLPLNGVKSFDRPYVVTAADVAREYIDDLGFTKGYTAGLDSVMDGYAIELRPCGVPDIKLTKTSDETCFSKVNDTLRFTIQVENTGDVELTGVKVTDPLTGLITTFASLSPGEIKTIPTFHIATAADIAAGKIGNKAKVIGWTVTKDSVTSADSITVPVCPEPKISINKWSNVQCFSKEGDTIAFVIQVDNTGNVVLTDVHVTDPLTGLDTTIATLNIGATERITTKYVVTDADFDVGRIDNLAIVEANDPAGTPVLATKAILSIDRCPQPAIEITKVSVENCFSSPGDTIHYKIRIKNTGTQDLINVLVSDPLTLVFDQTIPSLIVGASTTYGTYYIATDADITAGIITNKATATGQDNAGNTVSDEDSAVITVCPLPDISITKTADKTCFSAAGETITYTLVIKNTGNVPLLNVTVTDPLTGLNENIPNLNIGEEKTFTSTYVSTDADIMAGSINNTAKASGQDKAGTKVSDDATVAVTVCPLPDISITKTADKTCFSAAGETITYTIVVKNTGNVPLLNVTVTDPLTGLNENIPNLNIGEEKTFTSTYVSTDADILAGGINNTAKANGEDKAGTKVSDDASVAVTVCPLPDISITKTADKTCFSAAGETITYTLVVKNTGNVPLLNVTVTDPLTGLNENIPNLNIGEEKTFTSTYVSTDADIMAGGINNTAKANGEDKAGTKVSDDATVAVTVCPLPEISITKTAAENLFKDQGEVIHYSIVIKNTGNVPLKDVVVKDPLTGLDQSIGALAIGESKTINTTYTTTYTDTRNKQVENTATVTGKDDHGHNLTKKDKAVVPYKPPFHVPNVVTDNRDGHNDVFRIQGSEGYTLDVIIFNRWGSEVYKQKDYQNDWDGHGLNEGTYFYILHATKDGKTTQYKGWILLKR